MMTITMVALSFFGSRSFGQELTRTETRHVDSMRTIFEEDHAKDQKVKNDMKMKELKANSKEAKQRAREAQKVQAESAQSARESKLALRSEKKAQKHRIRADKQAIKAEKAKNVSERNDR